MKTIISILILTLTLFSCNQKNTKDRGQLTIGQDREIMQTPLEQSITRGKEVYNDFCKQCHRPKGKGIGKSYPPLAGSNWLTEKRTESIHATKFGLKGEIKVNDKTYNNIMAPMGLSNKEVADVMNYVMNTWGNTQEKMVTEEEVAAVEK